jgi:hypothetical protein
MSKRRTYSSPNWPCEICGSTERFCKGLRCVACNPTAPRRVSNNDPGKELEAPACEASEETETDLSPAPYSKDGPIEWSRRYVPTVLKEWPAHTDFRPDEMEVAN